jgi:hypothetical protein
MTSALDPSQFEVDEAWIVFQLNEAPIWTEQDGSFHCVCLMDAASCYILCVELIPTAEVEPSVQQSRKLLTTAWGRHGKFPRALFMPAGQFSGAMRAEAQRFGIEIVATSEEQLLVFIGEAREGYRETLGKVGKS